MNKYCLHLDFDYPIPKSWFATWKKEKTAMLERLGFTVTRIIKKPSPSRQGGSHVWMHFTASREVLDEEICMLEFLCGDCQTRNWINQLRIKRGLKKYWDKLFERHLWRKPLPEQCKKCRLRRILYEIKQKVENK